MIAFSFVIGAVTVLAEPAVHVLNKQVEEVTGGTVTKRSMMVALAIVGIVYVQFGDYQVMAIALGILFLEFIAMLIARAILSRKM